MMATFTAVCNHSWESLTAGIGGLTCRNCRQTWELGGAGLVMFQAFNKALDDMEERIERSEGALWELGATSCERCGEWWKKSDHKSGLTTEGTSVCSKCISGWYQSLDPADAGQAFIERTTNDIVRWIVRYYGGDDRRTWEQRTIQPLRTLLRANIDHLRLTEGTCTEAPCVRTSCTRYAV